MRAKPSFTMSNSFSFEMRLCRERERENLFIEIDVRSFIVTSERASERRWDGVYFTSSLSHNDVFPFAGKSYGSCFSVIERWGEVISLAETN